MAIPPAMTAITAAPASASRPIRLVPPGDDPADIMATGFRVVPLPEPSASGPGEVSGNGAGSGASIIMVSRTGQRSGASGRQPTYRAAASSGKQGFAIGARRFKRHPAAPRALANGDDGAGQIRGWQKPALSLDFIETGGRTQSGDEPAHNALVGSVREDVRR
ncbi:MAG: hypothetical protein NVSMB69_03500 [Novosphingobium sp.]